MKGAMESLSKGEGEVDDRLIKILEGLWGSYGCKTLPSIWRDGQGGDEEGRKRVEDGVRSLAGGQEVSVCVSFLSLHLFWPSHRWTSI
jgi:hypothetical protein